MRYLLDTDHISIIQRRVGPEFARLAERVLDQEPADVTFSVVSFHEQMLGGHTYINHPEPLTRSYAGI